MKKHLVIFISIIFISCSESKLFYNSIKKHKAPLGYLHDSKINDCEKSKKISIIQSNQEQLDTLTKVTKKNSIFLPLLFFNYYEVNLNVSLGQGSVDQLYSNFFNNSFVKECERTGCFSLVDTKNNSDYSIEFSFENCESKSQYNITQTTVFMLFAYFMDMHQSAMPSSSTIKLKVRLFKANKFIKEKIYNVENNQPFYNHSGNIVKLRKDFINNMAESLSMCTKKCVEQIINDINLEIENQENKLQQVSLNL